MAKLHQKIGPARNTQMRFWILSILCFAASLGVANATEEAARLDGFLTGARFSGATNSDGMPTVAENLTNAVNLTIGRDGRWSIECRRLYPPGDPRVGTGEAEYLAFDGADCYYVHYSEFVRQRKDGKVALVGPTPIAEKVNHAYVSKGNYPAAPFGADGKKFVHVLWILCGAGEAFHAAPTREIPLPWVAERWSLSAYGFRAEADLSVTPPYIPRQFRFVRDTKLDIGSLESEMEREELDKPSDDDAIGIFRRDLDERKRVWTNGLLAGELKTLEFTNWNGMELPLSFVFEDYNPTLLAPGKLADRYVGVFTNISAPESGESYQPPRLSRLAVIDSRQRFRDKERQLDKINYHLWPTNQWPSEETEWLSSTFAAWRANPEVTIRYPRPSVRKRRYIGTGLILLASFVVPLLLFWQAKRKAT